MRLMAITIPAGLALACLGGLLMLKAQDGEAQSVGDPKAGFAFNEPRHPVTSEMEKETGWQKLKPARPMTVDDARGGKHVLGGQDEPQFLLFILDGCPCSVDAQPIMGKLYQHFGGAVDFLGITDGDLAKAKDYWTTYSVPFPVIPDPKKEVIHAYHATNSVFSALLLHGKIVKMWPGYSVDMMKDINHEMAKSLGIAEKPFDTEYAPIAKTSGCAF